MILFTFLQEVDSEAALSSAELCRGRDGGSGDCQRRQSFRRSELKLSSIIESKHDFIIMRTSIEIGSPALLHSPDEVHVFCPGGGSSTSATSTKSTASEEGQDKQKEKEEEGGFFSKLKKMFS